VIEIYSELCRLGGLAKVFNTSSESLMQSDGLMVEALLLAHESIQGEYARQAAAARQRAEMQRRVG